MPEKAIAVRATGDGFEVETDAGAKYAGKTVILVAGARRRKLGVPGEDTFEGKGVAYCSTCDAPLFKGKRVVIVGAGNAALEAAIDSIPYASEITMMVRSNEMRGDPVTQEKVKSHPKIKILFNSGGKFDL